MLRAEKYWMFTFDNPYGILNGGWWVKGNLHVHTNRSDGSLEPQEVIDRYARLGYGFLVISDHDRLAPQEELCRYSSGEMLLIPGNEISRNGPHLLHVNAGSLIEPSEDCRQVIERINEDGGLSILCHPNWLKDFNHCPKHNIDTWQGYTGIEIFNGTIHTLPGSTYAADRWDMVLARRRRIWGFAGDDTHEQEDIGRGWIVVYTRDNSVGGIVSSLKTGAFYASSGVIIENIEVVQNHIKIETKNSRKIGAIADYGFRLKEVNDGKIHFGLGTALPNADRFKGFCHLDGKDRYIRFECWGEAEQFAWIQPFLIGEV